MHTTLTTMFYMSKKYALTGLYPAPASAMSLIGCALPSLHLSRHALPALSMPLAPAPSSPTRGARVPLQPSPNISSFSALSWHIWGHTPRIFLSCEGTFWLIRAICGEQLWDDSQNFIWEVPGFRSALQQILRSYLSPQHLGSKHLWTCTPEFSTRVVVHFELK